MTSSIPIEPTTRWNRSGHGVTLTVLLIVYAVGSIGILSSYSEYFVRLTFANLLLTALLLLISVKGFGKRAAVAFSIAALAGFAVEALGVKTGMIFGEYHYTDRLGPKLFDVPLVIGLNWAILVHCVHACLGARVRSRTLMAAIGATAMTAFDWVMEPAAMNLRFWVWRDAHVPLRNYVAWWCLAFLLLVVSERIQPRPSNRLAPWVLAVMLVFFAVVGIQPGMTQLPLLLIVVVTFCGMEWVAWASHKYLMHGWLWVLHRDHHRGPRGRLQRNDAFFVLFAIPSWLGIMLGMIYGSSAAVAIGAGIALYGFAYFLVHEVFIHRRLKFWRDTHNVYWLAVRKAHKQHHRHLEREDGECFGMLWVSRRYILEAQRVLARTVP